MPQQLWALGYLYQPKSTPLTGSGVAHCPCILEHRQQSGHKGPLSAKIASKRGGKDGERSGSTALACMPRAAEWPSRPHVGQTYLQPGRKSQRPGPAMYVRLDGEDLWCGRAKFNDFVQKRKFDQKSLGDFLNQQRNVAIWPCNARSTRCRRSLMLAGQLQ